MIRLQKYIADAGITSRRKAEDLIIQGRVEVNGTRVREMGTKVDPTNDVVSVDGEMVDRGKVEPQYIVLNKPRCYVTTVSDPEGRKTVMDLVQDCTERVYPVGRLDYLSEGLLILTNDGVLANSIIHPSFDITKVYEVKVFGAVSESILKKIRNGVQTEVGFLKPKSVRIIKQLKGKTWLEFRLSDGKNREIRRLCEDVGMTVDKLKRMAIGGLSVEGIAPGSYRYISKRQLLDEIGLSGKNGAEEEKEYWSRKKTVDIKRKGPQACSMADDKGYLKFRKDIYFKSIQELKERRKEEKKKKYDEWKKADLEKKKKFDDRKKEKEEKKHQRKSGAHASFV